MVLQAHQQHRHDSGFAPSLAPLLDRNASVIAGLLPGPDGPLGEHPIPNLAAPGPLPEDALLEDELDGDDPSGLRQHDDHYARQAVGEGLLQLGQNMPAVAIPKAGAYGPKGASHHTPLSGPEDIVLCFGVIDILQVGFPSKRTVAAISLHFGMALRFVEFMLSFRSRDYNIFLTVV